jgi:hypothetical protein
LTHSLILTRIEELQNQDSVSNDVLTNFLQSQGDNKMTKFFLKYNLKNFSLTDHKNLDIEILVDDFVTFFIAG